MLPGWFDRLLPHLDLEDDTAPQAPVPVLVPAQASGLLDPVGR